MQVLNEKVDRIVSKREKYRVSPREAGQGKSDFKTYLDANLEQNFQFKGGILIYLIVIIFHINFNIIK